jgi:REP element-mobilizing transposase RayT
MLENSKYISTNRSKHYLKCHLIFVCKYRKKLLTVPLNQDMKEVLIAIADLSDFEIELFESDGDHIHFLIRYIPRPVYLIHRPQVKAKIYDCYLEKVLEILVKTFLERTYILVRWLFRLFDWRSFSKYDSAVHLIPGVKRVAFIPPAEDRWVLRSII